MKQKYYLALFHMQILNLILGSCALLFLLFSIHLFFGKQGNRILNRLLSVIFFARFGQILVYLLVTSGQLTIFPVFLNIFTPFYYAAPACFYLYFTVFINDRNHFKKSDWLHFIPFILSVIHVLPWHSSASIHWNEIAKQISENKQLYITQKTGLLPPYFYYLGRSLLSLGYLFAVWYLVLTSPILREKGWNVSKIWIFLFIMVATVFKAISVFPLFFGRSHGALTSNGSFIALNCLILLFVVLLLLHRPRLLYGYVLVAVEWKMNMADSKEEPVPLTAIPSPKNNLLPEQLLSGYTVSMEELMENEKPFLQPGFQIAHLAQKLDIPTHHCSYVINNMIGKNFRDWINAYRISHFITAYPLLADKMTIEFIAFQSGFKSVATFYNAFKKETGLMPTTYFCKKTKN